jgi:hypothetical protein
VQPYTATNNLAHRTAGRWKPAVWLHAAPRAHVHPAEQRARHRGSCTLVRLPAKLGSGTLQCKPGGLNAEPGQRAGDARNCREGGGGGAGVGWVGWGG